MSSLGLSLLKKSLEVFVDVFFWILQLIKALLKLKFAFEKCQEFIAIFTKTSCRSDISVFLGPYI